MDHARVFGWISPLRFDTDVRNLILGYDQGVMSGIIGAVNQVDPSMFRTDTVDPDPNLQGTIVAIYEYTHWSR
jgi:hypothetical protein